MTLQKCLAYMRRRLILVPLAQHSVSLSQHTACLQSVGKTPTLFALLNEPSRFGTDLSAA